MEDKGLGQACHFLTIWFNVEMERGELGEKDNSVLFMGAFQPLLPSACATFSVVHAEHRLCTSDTVENCCFSHITELQEPLDPLFSISVPQEF